MKRERVIELWLAGFALIAGLIVVVVLLGTAAADGPPMSERAHLSFSPIHNLLSTNTVYAFGHLSVVGNKIKKNNFEVDLLCDEQDGCYQYADGCEERDYYCAGNGTGCNYTSSNRYTDSWVDTGNTRWVDENECQEKEQKEQGYRDYKCSEGSCKYSITDTKWVDTGIYNSTCIDVSLAPLKIIFFTPLSYVDDTIGNGRAFSVTANQAANVSWYLNDMLVLTNESVLEAKCMLLAEVVGEHNVTAIASNANGSDMQMWIWNLTELPRDCEGTDTCCGSYPNCENCNEQDGCYPHGDGCEERDYYCMGNGAGCNYTSANRHNDSWVDTGNTRWVDVNKCEEKEQKEQEYRDYKCSAGSCNYRINDTKWVDTGIYNSTCNCVPLAPLEITSFAPLSYVDDTVGNWSAFNVTVSQNANVSWYLNDLLVLTNESVREAKCTLLADVVGEHNVTAIASNANGSDMQMWIWNVTELPRDCEGTDTCCGSYPNCGNCNDQDGCYPHGDGCEERDYYCAGNGTGCNYTSSNRHNDSWVDTGNTRWVDVNECKQKQQKEQEYRDYKCSAGSCNYSINDTKWVDTGNTSIKANGTICGCTANNTVKRCYDGNCTDTGIGNASNCCADVACDGKKPGESCGDGRICNSTCNCVSLAPPGITSFAPLSYVDDTVGNWRTFNVTVNQAANVSWYLNDMLVLTNESVLEAKCTLHADVVGVHNVTAIASNANGSDMQMWIWNVTELPKACEGTDTCCGIYPNCENCNDQDGCYPHGDGCEERDYYCAGNGTGCNYTSSNRHNDSWVDTGNTRWVDENECKQKEQREQEYRDYECSAGSCYYSINDTKWVDTGIYNSTCNGVSLAPPEITSSAPLSYVDDTVGNGRAFNVMANQAANVSWYLNDMLVLTNESVLEAKCMLLADVVGEHNVTAIASNANGSDMQMWIWAVTEPPKECEGTDTCCGSYPNCENCNEQDGCYPHGDGCEERDYYCMGNGTGCNYTSANRHNDSWVDTGNTRWVDVNKCEEKEQKEQEYRDYKCSAGSCNYRINDTKWVDTGIYNSTCNGVSLAPPEITSSAPLSYVDDTVGNWSAFNVTVSQNANVSWYLNDLLVLTNESVLEAKCTLLADVVGEHNVTAIASNANGSDMQMWIWNLTELPRDCEGTDTCCGSYPNCGNCNEQDGCYPHGDGCEERDYYCAGNGTGCNYTSSNRHNDSWVDTGNTRWVDENECKQKEQKEQEYRDYKCSAGSCNYSINDTKWVDTGNTSIKANDTICGCTANNTVKRCYDGNCTDTGIGNASNCCADVACDGKEPGESCGDGRICNSTCNCVSLAPPGITSFAPLSYVDDTVGNWRTFNVTVSQAANVSWYLNDMLVLTNESVLEAKCTLHADVVGVHNVTTIASNANGSDMQMWIWAVSEHPKECEGTDTCCGIYPNCGNCNEQDGCYPYGDGCEKRDYYCMGDEEGCNYTSSNRHNDSWVDTGNTRWVDVNECQEKEQKEQEYRDYKCSAGSCNYSINNTKWLDTGNTSIKANGTICGCTANNTVKRCYDGNCTDTGIGNTSNCCADVACDGKKANCTCGDICVITTGWWRNGGAFHPTDTPIQAAIDNAISGDTICVKDGTYTENVDVDTQLTIRSENGAASTTVSALYSNDHVFEVTADYVSISGFSVKGAIGGGEAGIWLGSNIGHCNIYDNNASDNNYGIFLSGSSNNNSISGNTASNNGGYGIFLSWSSNNNSIISNIALNNKYGISLSSSSSNTIHSNTASNNDCGIRLSSTSNNNLIYNNYFNNIRNNAQDDGSNIWDITPTLGENIIGGSWQGGNYWSDYAGIDANGDGLGDTLLPYNSNGEILVGGDMHPLVPAGIAPLLSVEKTDDPDPVQAGGTLNYSISVSNKGYVNASAVTVTEIYDVNVTFESAIPAPSSGNDMWIFPALNANETKRINISVTVNPLTDMGTVLHNTVTVSCAEGVTDTDTEATTVFSGELNCTCGDICVIPTGWWRDGGAFHPTDTPIQDAIDNAIAGETICVKDGTYTENVDVNAQLTIRSENGAASTTVSALYSNDHVFEVTADYVSISGFRVEGATGGGKAGIWLGNNIEHCNISDSKALNNNYGIYLSGSSNNNSISGNTASNNGGYGIFLSWSSNNNSIISNIALNNKYGISLSSSSSNTIHSNTASNNDCGIRLSSTSNNNLIYNNYFNNIRNNAQDDGSNIWDITPTLGENIIGGSWLGGNYWSDYAGIDANGDGLGDTLLPYNANGEILVGGDMHPLVPAGIAPLLSLEKTDDPDPVQAGGTLNYSISVSNKGYVNASAVIVREIYDVNVTFDSAIPAPSSGNDMWIFPALNANETKRINISVTVNPLTAMGTVLHNTVTVSCAEGVTDTDTEATTVFSGEPNCTCGDICVIPTGWWRNGSAFHPTDTPIQDAIDNAISGETICVKDGTYTENVDVDTQLTIRSENGAASTTVSALYSNDHVFEVTADYVSISGFSVNGATGGGKAGIWLDSNIEHCNISDSKALDNNYGIFLSGSSNNNSISGNTASNNGGYGIYLSGSSNNNSIISNIALNNKYGISLSSSSSNTIHSNTASNNDCGIRLSSTSNNNLIYNNYFNNIRNNAQDDGSNIWDITPTLGENIIGGSWLGGNYWSDYAGIDANGDGLGDTLLPYNANGDILVGGDMHPLVPAGIAPLLSVEKTDDPDPVQVGGTLNYSIIVSNKGYINASAVIVREIYDVNVTFDSAIPAPSSGNDMWIFPALNANETKRINISVTVNPLTAMGTVLHNTVTVSCAEGVTDTDTEATTVFSGEPNCTCGDICVITTGWWRDGGAFHPSDTPIQATIDNATAGETICVKDGTYTENVDVNTQLTIRSENGAASTTVNALYSNDHVFEVTADYVSISGFSVKGATGIMDAGIHLGGSHCNISDNIASDNYVGIEGECNNHNTISGNTVSNNNHGIGLQSSIDNMISGNTVSNGHSGIGLRKSSGNAISGNTVSNNNYGIHLISSSNNNHIHNNYFNNTNNAQDDGTNIWNITKTAGPNIIGGSWLGGNYWSDYVGIDTNGDGLGDTLLPYNASGEILTGGDWHPLVQEPSPCFIATAAYGTPLHEDINVLRKFRDEYMMPNPAGQAMVKIYYTTSPPIADLIRANEGLRTAVRDGLVKPLVEVTRRFVE